MQHSQLTLILLSYSLCKVEHHSAHTNVILNKLTYSRNTISSYIRDEGFNTGTVSASRSFRVNTEVFANTGTGSSSFHVNTGDGNFIASTSPGPASIDHPPNHISSQI